MSNLHRWLPLFLTAVALIATAFVGRDAPAAWAAGVVWGAGVALVLDWYIWPSNG